MKKSSNDFVYTGIDNLEVMLEAERYNAFLTDLVLKYRPKSGAMLDFGAGIGTFSELVRDRGFIVDCLEVDAYQSSLLREKKFDVFGSSSDIDSGSYDYIFSLNVFEHIEDDLNAMQECARILKPGGRVLTYVPAFQLLFGDMDRKVQHYRRYTRRSLADLSKAVGLMVHKSEYVDIAGFFASLAYNATSNGSGDINSKAIRAYDRYVFPTSRFVDKVTSSLLGKNVYSVAQKPFQQHI